MEEKKETKVLLKEKSQNEYLSKIQKNFIESFAAHQDSLHNNHLLHSLIMKYARAERKLKELDQLKNKFLGMAAHDLRNPIAVISGMSEMLIDGDLGELSEDQIEMASTINEAAHTMLNLVNELLDVSVIESGKLDLDRAEHDLNELINRRIKLNDTAAKKKEMAIKTNLEPIPKVLFDRNRIAQVIDNILSNAIKYSPLSSTICVFVDQEDNMVRVRVKDEGPGLTEEDKEKLFGDFQKLSAKPTGGENSIGLGLAIVKKIIEAHNGSLMVESELGKGSTFGFLLPLT